MVHFVVVNFCLHSAFCNSERTIKIGQYLLKLCSNEKGSSFFDSECKNDNKCTSCPEKRDRR